MIKNTQFVVLTKKNAEDKEYVEQVWVGGTYFSPADLLAKLKPTQFSKALRFLIHLHDQVENLGVYTSEFQIVSVVDRFDGVDGYQIVLAKDINYGNWLVGS